MTSAQGVVSALYILFAILCVPPLLGVLIGMRRAHQATERSIGGSLFLVGALFSGAAFLFNLGVTIGAILGIARGVFEFGSFHVVAAALAWLCFWLWLTMVIMGKRRSRHRNW